MNIPLTARQAEILRLLELDHSQTEVALRLGISKHTVETHTERILDKLGIRGMDGLRYFLWKKKLRSKMEEHGLHKSLIDEILEDV
jgi:DNA-binding NarL/FixJ family response regulator